MSVSDDQVNRQYKEISRSDDPCSGQYLLVVLAGCMKNKERKRMKILKKEEAPQYERDNIRSYLLVGESTVGAKHITTTLVEMESGGVQQPHHHATEQCYMILEGSGIMEVEGEQRPVAEGDTVFIPSNSVHGLQNTGQRTLRYISAGSPVFGQEDEEAFWPLNR
jgi:mannose-6-phosphate isomerase-like protein (cupin superfamily)